MKTWTVPQVTRCDLWFTGQSADPDLVEQVERDADADEGNDRCKGGGGTLH